MGVEAINSHAKGKTHLRNVDQRKKVESVESIFLQPVTPANVVQVHQPMVGAD